MLQLAGSLQAPPPAAPLQAMANAVSPGLPGMPLIHTSLVLAAWRGREARVKELSAAGIEDAGEHAAAMAVSISHYAHAVLYNGLSRYDAALAAAQQACARGERSLLPWALPELVEAGTRSGDSDAGAAAVRRLEGLLPSDSVPHARGTRALSRALAGDDEGAEDLYQEAIRRLAGGGFPLHLARARLLYGEWLRRQGRRTNAREQLRAAEATFNRLGTAGFAERARRELLASGETARRRNVETRDDLTPQEAQIAALAGRGYTNPEIGAELFLSPRTVEWHLRNVFIKLGISSRRELRAATAAPERTQLYVT